MAVHEHITEAVKKPHLIRLAGNIVLARFETIKIYSALAAVRILLERGVVRPGQTLVDSSSGIYATSLALACHRFGMGCHIIASTTVDATVRAQLEILGATVEQMPPSSSLQLDQEARVRRVHQLLAKRPDVHWMQQYHDKIHYLGYREFADVVTTELGVGALTVVGGVGSGASTGGTAEYLRHENPAVQLIGLQPFGSVTFGSEHFNDPEAIIAGIGSSIPFKNVHHDLYDAIHWIDFRHAMAGAIALLRDHAIFAGLSTGAAYLVTQWLAPQSADRTHLIIGADTGHRYVERVFARHHEALDITLLKPKKINSLEKLEMPWSAMSWQRKPYLPRPEHAEPSAGTSRPSQHAVGVERKAGTSMTTTTYEVKGMTCDHCVQAVTSEVSALSGVTDVSVDLQTGRVKVTSATPVTEEQIRAAVDDAGYELVGNPI